MVIISKTFYWSFRKSMATAQRPLIHGTKYVKKQIGKI